MVAPSFDTSRAANAYASAFQQLAALPGFSQKAVLRAEAGSILKTWAGRTKVTTQERSDRTSRLQLLSKFGLTAGKKTSGRVSINAGVRGPVGLIWYKSDIPSKRNKAHGFRLAGKIGPDGGSLIWTNYHFSNSQWSEITQAAGNFTDNIAGYLVRGRASVGFARQSVIQIADSLGIDLNNVAGGGISAAGIAKARAAIASNGRSYQNGVGYEGGDETRGYIDLINSLPYGRKIGMDRTLAGVLAGRAGYIKQSYAHGAFASMARVAAAFPNIIRVQSDTEAQENAAEI